jgi:hypothetical protein
MISSAYHPLLNWGAATKPIATIPAQPALNNTSLRKVTQPVLPNPYGITFWTLKKEGSLRGASPSNVICFFLIQSVANVDKTTVLWWLA